MEKGFAGPEEEEKWKTCHANISAPNFLWGALCSPWQLLPLLRAFWASWVIASASSKITSLNPFLGNQAANLNIYLNLTSTSNPNLPLCVHAIRPYPELSKADMAGHTDRKGSKCLPPLARNETSLHSDVSSSLCTLACYCGPLLLAVWMLGMESRASHMLSVASTTTLHPNPVTCFFLSAWLILKSFHLFPFFFKPLS